MPTKRELKLIAFSAVFLLFIAGCGKGDAVTGAPTTPFLGGTGGLEISFLEGSPPEEVTDGDTFDFQAIVKLKNNGEHKFTEPAATGDPITDIKVSLIGFSPGDFRSGKVCTGDGTTACTDNAGCSSLIGKCGSNLKCLGDGTTACTTAGNECAAIKGTCQDIFADADLINKNPADVPTPRQRDSEGNIIEPTETFMEFPKTGKNFKFKGSLAGNTIFIFRADACYKYQTKAVSELCVLTNQIDVAADAICEPSGQKPTFSSGSPISVDLFRQSVVGKDKVQLSFDIVHKGSGSIFDPTTSADCPKTPTDRRNKEDKVKVTVKTGLTDNKLKCVGLTDAAAESSGIIKLVNGKRTITCTQDLDPGRNDFKKTADILVDFNYLNSADKEVLVKHLVNS